MKLFEFVPCCWQAAPPAAETASRRTEVTDALMQLSCATSDQFTTPTKRAKRTRPNSASEWRPSLHAITEDYAAAEKEKRMVGSEKKLAGKSGSTARIRAFEDKDDYRHEEAATTIPAFNPTAFLF